MQHLLWFFLKAAIKKKKKKLRKFLPRGFAKVESAAYTTPSEQI